MCISLLSIEIKKIFSKGHVAHGALTFWENILHANLLYSPYFWSEFWVEGVNDLSYLFNCVSGRFSVVNDFQ